jgi:hypothetical protein
MGLPLPRSLTSDLDKSPVLKSTGPFQFNEIEGAYPRE